MIDVNKELNKLQNNYNFELAVNSEERVKALFEIEQINKYVEQANGQINKIVQILVEIQTPLLQKHFQEMLDNKKFSISNWEKDIIILRNTVKNCADAERKAKAFLEEIEKAAPELNKVKQA